MTKWHALNWLNPVWVYHRLRHFDRDDWKRLGLQTLALALALLLFSISRQPMNVVLLSGVAVEYAGLPTGLEITGDILHTVSVRVRGPRDLVRALAANQFTASANLANKAPGKRVVPLKLDDVAHPDGVEVLRIEPASLELTLEASQRKRVNVEPQFTQPDAGLEVYSVRVEPPTLEIEGPQSQLNQVSLLKTEIVSLEGHRGVFSTTVDVELPQLALRAVPRAQVTFSVELGERRFSRLLGNVPVQFAAPAPRAQLLTKTVALVLYGPRAEVEALNEKTLRAEVDLAALPPTATAAIPKIQLPAPLAGRVEVKTITPHEVKFKR